MNAKIPSFKINELASAIRTFFIVFAQQKSSGKTTAAINMATKLILEGKKVAYVDLDSIRAAEDFALLNAENKSERIKHYTNMSLEYSKDQKTKGLAARFSNKVIEITKEPVLKIHGSSLSSFSMKAVKERFHGYDFIIIDLPANLYNNSDEIKPEISQLFIDSDLVIFPVKAEPQELKTAPILSRYVSSLKAFCESNKEIKTNVKFCTAMCFDITKYKGKNGTKLMADTIVEYNKVYGATMPAFQNPMVFRAIYPTQLGQGMTIYSSDTTETRSAQREFNLVVQDIINQLN